MKKEKKKYKIPKKTMFKATIIIVLNDGAVINGEGIVRGLRSNDGKKAHIVAEFDKDFPIDFK